MLNRGFLSLSQEYIERERGNSRSFWIHPAEKLAEYGATSDIWDAGLASEPTVSGIRSLFRIHRNEQRDAWWDIVSTKLSRSYMRWNPAYEVKSLPELDLPRRLLHRYLSTKTTRRLRMVPRQVQAH